MLNYDANSPGLLVCKLVYVQRLLLELPGNVLVRFVLVIFRFCSMWLVEGYPIKVKEIMNGTHLEF